jgi:HSP20 family molecular chaperone IbpA
MNVNESLQELQKMIETLMKLNLDHKQNNLEMFGQMQNILDKGNWSNIVNLTDFVTQNNKTFNPFENLTKITPRIEILRTLTEIIVHCEIPGLDPNSVKVLVTNGNHLTIQGEVNESESSDYLILKERSSGMFVRNINLPCLVWNDSIETLYKDGLLEIHLPIKTT